MLQDGFGSVSHLCVPLLTPRFRADHLHVQDLSDVFTTRRIGYHLGCPSVLMLKHPMSFILDAPNECGGTNGVVFRRHQVPIAHTLPPHLLRIAHEDGGLLDRELLLKRSEG